MKTYVIDLDGTLCSLAARYSDAKPITEHIKVVNNLKSQGARIVIFTARGMATFRGNRFLARIRWGGLTRRQLRTWGIQYDKLILGKPSGDIYVDDKGVNSSDFFPTKI